MKHMEINGDSGESSEKGQRGDIILAQSDVAEAVEELMEELDTEQNCAVDVTVDGKWCTFEGTVDSQEMRMALFDLVPVQDGKRFIVDRLHVTYEAGHVDECNH